MLAFVQPTRAPKLQLVIDPKKWIVNWLHEGYAYGWNGESFSKTLSDGLRLNVSEATRIKSAMEALGFTLVFISKR
jgi:hypothetical protein